MVWLTYLAYQHKVEARIETAQAQVTTQRQEFSGALQETVKPKLDDLEKQGGAIRSIVSETHADVRDIVQRLDDQSEYTLCRVSDLDPGRYVPRYVSGLYINRIDHDTGMDADSLAREHLRNATGRGVTQSDDPFGPIGVCIFGKPMEGKTRLAWEATRDALSEWTILTWPHGPAHPFDFQALHADRIVLWLDNLHEYANPAEAPKLNNIVRRFSSSGIPLVVVATCRDGIEERHARGHLANLLRQLVEIRPIDLSMEESERLAEELAIRGIQVYPGDGTPGSLLLGVEEMAARYEQLGQDGQGRDAQRLLKTMKLLRSAGTYDYPPARLRIVARARFNLPENSGAYTDAADRLEQEGFVRLKAIDGTSYPGLHALEPVADVYLERAIRDYPNAGHDVTEEWPALREPLTEIRDGAALNTLGIAFNELRRGFNLRAPHDLNGNQTEAIAAYRAALEVRTRKEAPADWAMTQNNLGVSLSDQAALAEGEARASLLDAAIAAYRAALEVRTRKEAPADWAATQYNMALLYLQRAVIANDQAAKCVDLRAAHVCLRDAQPVLRVAHPSQYRTAAELIASIEEAVQQMAC